MKIPITLAPQGVIPRDPKIAVRLKREPEPVTIIETIAEGAPPVVPPEVEPLVAGTDVWYDSPNVAVIPFRQIDREVCPDTNNVGFDLDDGIAFEGDYLTGSRSAWWQISVPPGVTDAVLTADTWQSVPAPTSSAVLVDCAPDTVLELITTSQPPPIGVLPSVDSDFSTMSVVAYSDDDPDPEGFVDGCLSRITSPLNENTVYWVRVSLLTEPDSDPYYDTIYRLRLSLAFTPAP